MSCLGAKDFKRSEAPDSAKAAAVLLTSKSSFEAESDVERSKSRKSATGPASNVDIKPDLPDAVKTIERHSQPGEFKQVLLQQVEDGFNRRNKDFIETCFKNYEDSIKGVRDLEKQKLLFQASLAKFGSAFRIDELGKNKSFDVALQNFGSDRVTLEIFKQILSWPSDSELWAQSLPVLQLFADALPKGNAAESQLKRLSCLSDGEIDDIVEVHGRGLKRLLLASRKDLVAAYLKEDDANQQASKFEAFTAQCGQIEDFHKGISGSGKLGEFIL
jgi:hypothetical protein